MFTETAYEAFMKLKQVRRRSWGGGLPYIYICIGFPAQSCHDLSSGPWRIGSSVSRLQLLLQPAEQNKKVSD